MGMYRGDTFHFVPSEWRPESSEHSRSGKKRWVPKNALQGQSASGSSANIGEAGAAPSVVASVDAGNNPQTRVACTLVSRECLEALVPSSGISGMAVNILMELHKDIEHDQAKWLVNSREVHSDDHISDLLTDGVLVCQLVIRQLPGVPVGMVLKRVFDIWGPPGNSLWCAFCVASRSRYDLHTVS